MLKYLTLNNIVLVESAQIDFSNGFNVLSGESGAGKSAILNALNLIAGERSDTSYIRRGAEKGIVQAAFDIDQHKAILSILEEAGVDHDSDSELIIRRELTSAGKSRAFINNQQVQLALLKQVSELLFEVVGQHANQKLLSLDYHRNALDLFGNLEGLAASFKQCWEEESKAKTQLATLISSEAERMRQIEICKMEIEELEEANIQEGEEEELFSEYTQLSHADELIEKAGEINRLLNGERTPILPQLYRAKAILEQLTTLSPALSDTLSTLNTALVELDEVSHTMTTFEARIESNPARAEQLNTRLDLITKLKRKYGNTLAEVNNYLKASRSKLGQLENADEQIEVLQQQVQKLSEMSNQLAAKLTQGRTKAAISLSKTIVEHLKALNMPKVEIAVEISPQNRTKHGDDKVEIYITPNVGEHKVSLRECASGGELSRTMLALQAVLAGKEQIPTLIFDEIDANIGGQTATVVGEKLLAIAQDHQVLCITHFPQVAKLAQHHIRISKQEIDGRTLTLVESLDEHSHQEEIARMMGE